MFKGKVSRNIIILVMFLALGLVVSSYHNNIPCAVYAKYDYEAEEKV